DTAFRRLDHRRRVLQPEQQRLRGLCEAAPVGVQASAWQPKGWTPAGRLSRLWASLHARLSQQTLALWPLLQRPRQVVPHALPADRLDLAHALFARPGGPG